MVGSGQRAQAEAVALHTAAGLRVLGTARRAILGRNAALAHVVLAFEGEARTGLRAFSPTGRADAVGERLIDCAMRVGELARVAWRPDREPPDDDDVRRLVALVDGIIEDAGGAVTGSTGQLADVCEQILRAERLAVALCRQSELRRLVWRAS